MTKEQIISEAMALDPRERNKVAEAIWQNISPGELYSEQLGEIRRRLDAIDSGEVQFIPGDEVMRGLWQRLGR